MLMVKRAIVRLLRVHYSRHFRLPRRLDIPRELFDWLWWESRVEKNDGNPLLWEIRLVPVPSKESRRRYAITELNKEEEKES